MQVRQAERSDEDMSEQSASDSDLSPAVSQRCPRSISIGGTISQRLSMAAHPYTGSHSVLVDTAANVCTHTAQAGEPGVDAFNVQYLQAALLLPQRWAPASSISGASMSTQLQACLPKVLASILRDH